LPVPNKAQIHADGWEPRGISVEETQRAAMHAIRSNRNKPLAAEPHSGHNRYHRDIAPVVEIGAGEGRMINGEQGKEMTNSPDIAKAASW
jgi:hypothetical protein